MAYQDAIAKLSFLGMLKEQSLPLFIPASIQRTAVPHLILEIRRHELIADTLAQVRPSPLLSPCPLNVDHRHGAVGPS